MSSALLQVKDLKKTFVVDHKGLLRRMPVTVRAVDGVSFEIEKGETFGIVGESGSGKSTVAYTLIGMYRPTSGQILFRGEDLFGQRGQRPLRLKKEVQIVFQDPGSSLNPRRTVREILELPLRIHQPNKNPRQEVSRLLELVELPVEYMHKYPRSLSGGEKQIVGIARALATRPSLIILDEPTSALDVSIQAKIINLLLRLQREFQLTYLFITHDLSLMRNVATHVGIMYLGRLSEIARTVDFFRNPQHPYTKMLLSSIPVTTAEEQALKPDKIISSGEIPSPVNIPSGCSFRTRCPAVMDICQVVDPSLLTLEPGHRARCHLLTPEVNPVPG